MDGQGHEDITSVALHLVRGGHGADPGSERADPVAGEWDMEDRLESLRGACL
jgi:hypothetical protein